MAKQAPVFHSSICLVDRRVTYLANDKELWHFNIGDLVLIGEYTTPHGPADDYFWVFFTRQGLRYEAALYSNGEEDFRKSLSTSLSANLEHGLCNSTDFKSRVLWPAAYEGDELFAFTPERPMGLWQKLFSAIGFGKIELQLTERVRQFLKPEVITNETPT